MARCAELPRIEAWAKAGAAAGAPPRELSEHAEGCAACGPLLSEVLAVRGAVRGLEAHTMNEERRDAIRFSVTAEARRASQGRAARPLTGLFRRVAWGIGLAASLALALYAFQARREATSGTPTRGRSLAAISLLPGALGHHERSAPDEIYRLEQGEATFRVTKLEKDQRFRVLAGDGSIEVRGTRFRVHVEQGHLERVDVDEGEVLVWLGNRPVADLLPGDGWVRPAAPPAAASASGAEPEGPAPVPTVDDRVTPPSTRATTTASAPERPADAAFAHAWKLLGSGQPAEAAAELDALALSPGLDRARLADVLYWTSQAYARSGNRAAAESRARRLLRDFPSSVRAPDAALIVGQTARARGDRAEAKFWLDRAVTSVHPAVRSRALAELSALGPP